jgi:hypothetical protein
MLSVDKKPSVESAVENSEEQICHIVHTCTKYLIVIAPCCQMLIELRFKADIERSSASNLFARVHTERQMLYHSND